MKHTYFGSKFISVLLAALLIGAGLLWAAPARADEPCDVEDFSTNPGYTFVNGVAYYGGEIFNWGNISAEWNAAGEYLYAYGIGDGTWSGMWGGHWEIPLSHTAQEGNYISVQVHQTAPVVWAELVVIYTDETLTWSGHPGPDGVETVYLDAGKTVQTVILSASHYGNGVSNASVWFDNLTFGFCNEPPTDSQECELVQNAGFADTTPTDWLPGDGLATGNWLLQGSAAIADSTLSLPRGASASQKDIPTQPNLSYQTVISVSNVAQAATLRLSLGNGLQMIDVDAPGVYMVSLTSPDSSASTLVVDNATGLPLGDATVDIDVLCISSSDDDLAECNTVQNSNFTTDQGWTINNLAAISNGLSLAPGGKASQNVSTLVSNVTYNAVVSVTQAVSSASLSVSLGDQAATLNISAPGSYVANLTTPANLSGPIKYELEHGGGDYLEIAFTCISPASSGPGGTQANCIAPVNGTFDTDTGWNWHRGATWLGPAQKASLPFANIALMMSSQTYSLPTVASGEYLLLSFTARKEAPADTLAGIMGQVRAGETQQNFVYEVFPNEYTFETSLNLLAGQSGAEVAFVNPGSEGSELINSQGDLVVDNICIFKSNRPPNMPAPTDPDGIAPVDLGFNYTSCDDIDGILAYFGVNIQQYRAEYEAGVSLWDYAGWVPWLNAAFWNILATYLCLFMAAFTTLIAVIEYVLNNFLNFASWIIRSATNAKTWANLWLMFTSLSLANLSEAYGNFLASWANWIGDSLANANEVIGTFFADAMEWTGASLANLSEGLALFLANWSDWIALSLANSSEWVARTLANGWAWLSDYLMTFNGLRVVINWLIEAWNIYLAALGEILSLLIEALVSIWNYSLHPFLQAVWDSVYWMVVPVSLFSLLLQLALSIWDLFWMLLGWIWANVFVTVNLPITFYYAFNDGVQTEAFSSLMSCADTNFWCGLLAGTQLVNQTVGHTVLYPIVIMGIILATLAIFWRHIWALFSINIR